MQINLAVHHFVSRKTGLESVFLIVEIELDWKNVVAATLLQSNDLVSVVRRVVRWTAYPGNHR